MEIKNSKKIYDIIPPEEILFKRTGFSKKNKKLGKIISIILIFFVTGLNAFPAYAQLAGGEISPADSAPLVTEVVDAAPSPEVFPGTVQDVQSVVVDNPTSTIFQNSGVVTDSSPTPPAIAETISTSSFEFVSTTTSLEVAATSSVSENSASSVNNEISLSENASDSNSTSTSDIREKPSQSETDNQNGQTDKTEKENEDDERNEGEGDSSGEEMQPSADIDKIKEEIREGIEKEWQEKMKIFEDQAQARAQSQAKEELGKYCIELEGVGYYCLKEKNKKTEESGTRQQLTKEVYSQKESDSGDTEIFLESASGKIQITRNDYDDMFPYLDPSGSYISFQSLISGVWQIFIYDISQERMIQVTDSDYNNMNPRIGYDGIAWQSWIDGNWEIVFAPFKQECKTSSEEKCFEAIRVTKNSEHDMFPKIGKGYVIWQAFKEGNWQVFAYNTSDGKTTQVTTDFGNFENPRIAIVWDEKTSGGGVRRFGYDLSTGKIEAFGNSSESKNGQAPFSIPEVPTTKGSAAGTISINPSRPVDQEGQGNDIE